MKILGIDPGNARLGYGLIFFKDPAKPQISTCGVIETSKNKSEPDRLAEIRSDLISLIDDLQPEIISVEKLFFFKNMKTVMPVAHARGVILEVAGSKKIPVFEYTPLQIKQTICGHGRAEKSLVEEMVKREFNITADIKPDDAVDAVAIALCYLRSDYLQTQLLKPQF